jgi:hypothetical protein
VQRFVENRCQFDLCQGRDSKTKLKNRNVFPTFTPVQAFEWCEFWRHSCCLIEQLFFLVCQFLAYETLRRSLLQPLTYWQGVCWPDSLGWWLWLRGLSDWCGLVCITWMVCMRKGLYPSNELPFERHGVVVLDSGAGRFQWWDKFRSLCISFSCSNE